MDVRGESKWGLCEYTGKITFKTYRLKDVKIAITAEASSRESVPQRIVSQEAENRVKKCF